MIISRIVERPVQILCYMTSWSQKRPGIGRFSPDNIDPTLCTHVIYAFGLLKDNRLTVEDKEDENYAKVVALKEKNPNLKVKTRYRLALAHFSLHFFFFKRLIYFRFYSQLAAGLLVRLLSKNLPAMYLE